MNLDLDWLNGGHRNAHRIQLDRYARRRTLDIAPFQPGFCQPQRIKLRCCREIIIIIIVYIYISKLLSINHIPLMSFKYYLTQHMIIFMFTVEDLDY